MDRAEQRGSGMKGKRANLCSSHVNTIPEYLVCHQRRKANCGGSEGPSKGFLRLKRTTTDACLSWTSAP